MSVECQAEEVEQGEDYVFVNGVRMTMRQVVEKVPFLGDMILEGSYGDPDEVIDLHMEFEY